MKKDQAKLFFEISRDLALTSSPNELLAVIVNYVNKPELQSAVLYSIEVDQVNSPQRMNMLASWGGTEEASLAAYRADLSNFALAQPWMEQPEKPLLVGDIATDKRLNKAVKANLSQVQTAAVASVPLRVADQRDGLLILNWSTPQRFDPDSEYLYGAIGVQIAAILRNWQLSKQLQFNKRSQETNRQLNRRLLALQSASATVTSSLDQSQILITLASAMVDLLEMDGCAMHEWLVEEAVIVLRASFCINPKVAEDPLNTAYKLEDFPLVKNVLLYGDIEQVVLSQEDIDPSELHYMQQNKIKTQIMLPMKFEEKVIGLVEVWDHRSERVCPEDLLELAQLLTNHAAIAIENARLYEQARQEISERKKTELALRESEARHRALLNAIPDVMIRRGRDGTYLDVHATNPADLLVPANELIGQRIDDLSSPPSPNLLHSIKQATKLALETGEMQVFDYQILLHGVVKDFEARTICSGQDEVISIIRDMTERKQLEAQLRQAHKMEAIGQLAAGIAHDFNNILTSILGYAELLGSDPTLSPAAQQDLQRILRQGERAAHLVRQILDFARTTDLRRQNINLEVLVEEIVTTLLDRTLPEEIYVALDVEPGDYRILADPVQIQQALINLALNARDAMPGGGNLFFSLSQLVLNDRKALPLPTMQSGEWIRLTVTDTGLGIRPDVLPNVFDPFFTTKEVGKGSGLGLAQVFGIVKSHQGHITIESRLAEGTSILIYLPALSSSESTPEFPNQVEAKQQ